MWLLCVLIYRWRVPVRYSRYDSIYVEPTIQKKDLEKPLEEGDERNFKPIKAATNEQVSTSTYDPLIA